MGTLGEQDEGAEYVKPPVIQDEPVPTRRRVFRTWRMAALLLALLILLLSLPPVINWQNINQQRTLSLSNMRRIGGGLLIYSEDWDKHLMPPSEHMADGSWRAWPQTVRPYVTPDDVFSNPSNPVKPFQSHYKHPTEDRSVDSAYAINRRFWNTFSTGPFPYENLEMPEQTVLLVEAGPMRRNPRKPRPSFSDESKLARDDYGDTLDLIGNLSPYPSMHDGKMAVVAADGHGVIVTVEHYSKVDGPHDPLYGRIGIGIFNWNGGHPNGETDRPARQ